MTVILILLGIMWIVIGGIFIFFPEASKEKMHAILKKNRIKLISAVSVFIGTLLVWGSPAVSAPWIPVFLGVLAILKGLFFILAPEKKTVPFVNWWLSASNFRVWGIISFFIGVIMLLIIEI